MPFEFAPAARNMDRHSTATISQALESARKAAQSRLVGTGLSRTDALASIPTFPFVMQEKRRALRFGASADGHPCAWSRQAGELKLRERKELSGKRKELRR
jgi:hypothetical protein